jgi:hypothetical protein
MLAKPLQFRAIAAAVLVLAVTSTGALSVVTPGDGRSFAIQRNGEDIGRHEVTFERQGDRLDVRIKVEVDYRLLFIPVYRFEHEAHEVWVGGALRELRAKTNDNGESFDVVVRPNGSGLVLRVNGEERDVGRDAVPSSLWRQDMARPGQLIDPADGEVMMVNVGNAEWEDITVRGETIRARRYVMTGDLDRELWYDAAGMLVKVRFAGEDGSDLQFRML